MGLLVITPPVEAVFGAYYSGRKAYTTATFFNTAKAAMQNNADATLAFTNYGDLCEGKLYKHRLYLEIKRMLLWAFYLKRSHRSKWMKKVRSSSVTPSAARV